LDGPERVAEWAKVKVVARVADRAEVVTGRLQVVIIKAESLITICVRR
jgi:hypothetical protein